MHNNSTTRPGPVSFAQALRYWLRLGFISFGGPAGQIAIMHRDLVDERRWISERRFLHALNYCMVLPGPEAQQLATYIGWLMHGVRGGIAAGALFVLPSLLLLVGLSWLYVAIGKQSAAELLYGIKPAVVAVVAFAAWRIGSRVLKQPELWAIAVGAFVGVFLLGLPFPLLILVAGLLGWLLRHRIRAAGGHGGGKGSAAAPALIDDGDSIPAHARFTRRGLVTTAIAGLLLWALSLGGVALLGVAVYTSMGVFFTKAALVTFGGAYAVMPYVFQNAVEIFQWLTPAQMLDGLALGETTPGPLIMVVAFIGFVGAWAATHGAVAAGMTGAAIATWFTFLPSFVFILAGGPFVEHTREDFKLAGPLTAITAAVVGAILYLAVYFAGHVFFPESRPDWLAMGLAAGAFVAMYRNWLGMIPVILVSGILGALAPVLGFTVPGA